MYPSSVVRFTQGVRQPPDTPRFHLTSSPSHLSSTPNQPPPLPSFTLYLPPPCLALSRNMPLSFDRLFAFLMNGWRSSMATLGLMLGFFSKHRLQKCTNCSLNSPPTPFPFPAMPNPTKLGLGSSTIFCSTLSGVMCTFGGFPTASSYSVMPRLHTSALPS